MWKSEDHLEVIEVEFKVRELSEGIKASSQKGQIPSQVHTNNSNSTSASSLLASSGKVQCVYCAKDHFLASCDKLYTVKEWKDTCQALVVVSIA